MRPTPLLVALLLATGCVAPSAAAREDSVPLEDHDPLALSWVAPAVTEAGPARVAVGQPLDLSVATQHPAARVVRFLVDGREVGACDPEHDPDSAPEALPVADPAGDPALDPPTAFSTDPEGLAPDDPSETSEPDEFEDPTDAQNARQLANGPLASGADDAPVPASALVPTDPDAVAADPDEPRGECHVEDGWQWTVRFDAPGRHTLSAVFDLPDGTRVTSTSREIEVTAQPERDPAAPPDDDPAYVPGDDPSETTPVDELPPGPIATTVSALRAAGDGLSDPRFDWHSHAGGREWSQRDNRVYLRSGALEGATGVIARCMALYHSSFERYADGDQLSRASLVAAAVASTGCAAGRARGLMGLSGARCAALRPTLDRHACAARMRASPDFAIETAAHFLARTRDVHHRDAPRMAAVYSAGGLRTSRADAWHMKASRGFIDRYVAAYNAFRSWERLGKPLDVLRNPVLDRSCADPGVVHVTGGEYDMVCTGSSRFPLWHSRDLRSWEPLPGAALFPGGHPWGRGNFWAPEIHEVPGAGFVAVYSAVAPDGMVPGGCHRPNGCACIGAATADRVTGPWTDLGGPIVCDSDIGLIDPNLLVDTAHGNALYLYWKTEGNALSPQQPTEIYGRQVVLARRSDGTRALAWARPERPTRVLVNRPCDRNGCSSWEGHVVEAPWVHYRAANGWYYLFYSGNVYDQHYRVGVARARSPLGQYARRAVRNPPERPLLGNNHAWLGPGHGSVVPTPRGDYFVYHAWRPRPARRPVRVCTEATPAAPSRCDTRDPRNPGRAPPGWHWEQYCGADAGWRGANPTIDGCLGRVVLTDRIGYDAQGWPHIGAGTPSTGPVIAP